MILTGFIGPLDKWQVELRKASKNGLIERLEWVAFVRDWSREDCLKMAQVAKQQGRYIDAHEAHLKFMQDPRAAVDKAWKKSVAAKKAARRRKKAKR